MSESVIQEQVVELPVLENKCCQCDGLGNVSDPNSDSYHYKTCSKCNGEGV